MMQRPAIRGIEILVAAVCGICGGYYTFQPALENMRKRNEAISDAKDSTVNSTAVSSNVNTYKI